MKWVLLIDLAMPGMPWIFKKYLTETYIQKHTHNMCENFNDKGITHVTNFPV